MCVLENDDEYNVRFEVDESGRATGLVFIHWTKDDGNRIERSDN